MTTEFSERAILRLDTTRETLTETVHLMLSVSMDDAMSVWEWGEWGEGLRGQQDSPLGKTAQDLRRRSS